jgi:hypothetical protein
MSSNDFVQNVTDFFGKISGQTPVALVVTHGKNVKILSSIKDAEKYASAQLSAGTSFDTVWLTEGQDPDNVVYLIQKVLGNKLYAIICKDKQSESTDEVVVNLASDPADLRDVLGFVNSSCSSLNYEGYINFRIHEVESQR